MQSKYVLLNKKQEEPVRNVYELPSTKQIIRYLHACAGIVSGQKWRISKNGEFQPKIKSSDTESLTYYLLMQ